MLSAVMVALLLFIGAARGDRIMSGAAQTPIPMVQAAPFDVNLHAHIPVV